MADHGDDSYDRPGNRPRRAETLPVRFNETPSETPNWGFRRRHGRDQRHAAGMLPQRGAIIDEDEYLKFYDDQRTSLRARRTFSPSPPPPRTSRSRPRSPPVTSLASIEPRRVSEFTHPGSAEGYRRRSHYNPISPAVVRERKMTGEYYLDRAAAIPSPYLTRHGRSRSRGRSRSMSRHRYRYTRSRSRGRSRSNSRHRYRYTRSRSSSYGKVPNLKSYDVKYGGLESRAAEIDFGLSMPDSESYSFRLSHHNNGSLQSENTQGSNSGRFEKEAPTLPLQSHSSLTTQRPKVDRIIQSRYTGDGIMGGMHFVEFTVAPGEATSAGRLPIPLYNWIRFEDCSMDFDGFQNSLLNLDGLKGGERSGISKLLERVKRIYDKTVQVSSRTKVRRMIPKLLQEPIRDDTPAPASKPRNLTWLCLPYFSLQKYTSSDVQSSSHPPRTLLQTRQFMTPKERDLKQAVCHLPDTPAGSCFHIGQAWFLILEDSFIISCTGLSTGELIKKSISIVPHRSNSPELATRTLLVSGYGSTLWSLPLGECKTWIDFLKHFLELWPLRFEFFYGGSKIISRDWPRIFKQAERSKVDLEFKFSSKSKKSPTGVLNASGELITGPSKDTRQKTKEDGASNLNVTDLNTPRPDLNQKDSASPSAHPSPARKTLLSNEFHIFNWMNTQVDVPNSSNPAKNSSTPNIVAGVNEILLQEDLQEIDDYLLKKTNLSERFAYTASPRHTRKQFYHALAEADGKVQADQSLRKIYALQVELANAADALFGFFLSPQHSGPTTEKYWGPLYDMILAILPSGLIQPDESSENDNLFPDRPCSIDLREARKIADWMDFIGRQTEQFQELLSGVPIVERCEINISDKLPRAWLHLLMALALTKDMPSPWYMHMNLCLDLMNEGMKETLRNISHYQLSDYVVFAPFDMASLITFQLSQDSTGLRPDICETYIDYMRSLEFDIDADPINREHQGRITDLRQETSVILETLETQREVLNDAWNVQLRSNFQDCKINRVVPPPKYEYRPSSTFLEPRARFEWRRLRDHDTTELDLNMETPSPNNPRGIRGLLFRESLALIEERIDVFCDIDDRAIYLESWNQNNIDTNKDRQETAVYAFTIVTIIFLPLSTVASILGMNTNDVRNMDLTQWLFWVTAIPLTMIIIALVLIWSGEWHNFRSGIRNLWGKKAKRTFARLPEDYTRVEPRTRFRKSHTLFGG